MFASALAFTEADFTGAFISGARILDARVIYSFGESRGEGARFEEGHSSVNPASSCGAGVTRKLRLAIAWWILEK